MEADILMKKSVNEILKEDMATYKVNPIIVEGKITKIIIEYVPKDDFRINRK